MAKIRIFVLPMRIVRSIVSFLLASLVLLASSSFYVSSHACGGHIIKVAFLEKADGCGHAQMPPCHRALMKGCCEDEVVTHDAQDLKMEAPLHLTYYAAVAILPSPVVLADVIPSPAVQHIDYCDYDPPLPADDLVVAHRVFLI